MKTKRNNVLALMLMSLLTTSVLGATTDDELIKKLEMRLGVGQIESITKTGYGELLEVKTKSDVVYADKTGSYLVSGRIIEVASGKNLTEERLNEINKVDFKTLPLQDAIKFVKGNGKRVMAIFEDPNCGYCKVLRRTLQSLDNVTIYTFQYNILTPDSKTKSRDIWCSPDKSKAWDEWMLNGKVPAPSTEKCVAPHEAVLDLGKKYRVTGTPAIVFADGSRIPGAVDAKTLEDRLAKTTK